MIDLPVSVEQEKRETQEIDSLQEEANLDVEMYSGGFFDGLMGSEPSSPSSTSYWDGYALGYREYWAAKLSVEIATEA